MNMSDEIRTQKTNEIHSIYSLFIQLFEGLINPNGEHPCEFNISEEEYKNKLDHAFRLYYELNRKRVQMNIDQFENSLKDYDAKMLIQMENYKKETKEQLAYYISLRDR
tara:strand:+ start:259 stop:585 length:327 start_codon:yes stop_codon:yes gene_type:complete